MHYAVEPVQLHRRAFLLIISKFMGYRLGSLSFAILLNSAPIISHMYAMQLVKADVEVAVPARPAP